jgi:hypothetical protein
MSESEWELSSGLPLDGATVTVAKAEFGYRQNIAKDTTFACFTFQPDEGDEQEQAYSCGKGWEPGARGETLVTSDGKSKKLNDQTGYGKFIAAAMKLPGCLDTLRARGHYTNASVWVGMRFRLESVKEMTKNPTTGQEKETSRIMPVEFLGVVGEGGAVVASAAVAVVASSAPAVSLETENAELFHKLVGIAKASPDHDSFMAAAFAEPGVAGVTNWENAVMASGSGSIWAKGQEGK